MGKRTYPSDPFILEHNSIEPLIKKRHIGEQDSAALTLLLLRDGSSTEASVNQASKDQACLPEVDKQTERGVHVTDDEGDSLSRSSIASKRTRPVLCVSSAKSIPNMPVRSSPLCQPPHFLPVGRPLAAPPTLGMPRGFQLRQPTTSYCKLQ